MGGRDCYHCKQWVEEGEAHDCWTTTEAALTEGACAFFDPELPPPEVPIADMSVMGAVRILRMYERRGR